MDSDQDKPAGTLRQALEISLIYAVFTSALLFLLDNLRTALGRGSELALSLQSYQGVVFVLVTTGFLYFVVRGYLAGTLKRRKTLQAQFDEMKRQTEELEEKVERLGRIDPLTDAGNRFHLLETLDDEYNRSKRHGHPLALLLFDVDDFKNINASYGHRSADDVLIAVAKAAADEVRQNDLVARIDARTFAILMPETTGEQARTVAQKVRNAVAGVVVPTSMGVLRITASMGVSDWSKDDISSEKLFERADRALQRAKSQGRNMIELVMAGTARAEEIPDPSA